jgi:hypothetical protein
MQVFLADLMVSSDNAALEERPATLDGVRMNCANDMLTNGVIDCFVREAMLQPHISGISIGAEKANSIRIRSSPG